MEASNNIIYPLTNDNINQFNYYGQARTEMNDQNLNGQGYVEVSGGDLRGGLDELVDVGAQIRIIQYEDMIQNVPQGIRTAVERYYAP